MKKPVGENTLGKCQERTKGNYTQIKSKFSAYYKNKEPSKIDVIDKKKTEHCKIVSKWNMTDIHLVGDDVVEVCVIFVP